LPSRSSDCCKVPEIRDEASSDTALIKSGRLLSNRHAPRPATASRLVSLIEGKRFRAKDQIET
jgi:hypothetical protein